MMEAHLQLSLSSQVTLGCSLLCCLQPCCVSGGEITGLLGSAFLHTNWRVSRGCCCCCVLSLSPEATVMIDWSTCILFIIDVTKTYRSVCQEYCFLELGVEQHTLVVFQQVGLRQGHFELQGSQSYITRSCLRKPKLKQNKILFSKTRWQFPSFFAGFKHYLMCPFTW